MYLTTVICFVFISVSDCQCPPHFEDEAFIERFVVKEDPFEHINGKNFTDYWTKAYYTKMSKCAYTVFESKPDGSIMQNAHYVHETGFEITGTELMKRTDKTGIFSVSGTYGDSQKEYSGKMYIVYADETALAYYSCEENGVNWNISVLLKASLKNDIVLKDPENKPWKSLSEGLKNTILILLWPGVNQLPENFSDYDLKLC